MSLTIQKFLSPLRLFVLFMLWSYVLTFPLPLHFFSHIPLGSEEAATVPFFNLWTLQWNIEQQMQGYPRYWDAPIFAPDKGTFAFSEPQLLSALLAAPLWLAFQSPAVGYNFVIILFLTLNGWFAFWLLRSWGVSFWPSLLAGLLMQSLPFVAQEMGVLQLIAIFGFLWSLLFLSRFLSSSSPHRLPLSSSGRGLASSPHLWQTGLCLALGTPLTFLTCSYYGLFSLFFLPLAFLFQLRRQHLGLKTISQFLAIALLATALAGSFLWAQQQRLAEYHFSRSAQTIEGNSAKPEYYGNFLDYHLLYSQILGLKSAQGQRLFLGLGLLALAGLGLLGGQGRRVKLYLILAVALALLLSLGLRLNVGGVQPYQWVRDFVPGFAQLRSPFRFALFAQLHLALLGGFGLDNLGRWLIKAQTSSAIAPAAGPSSGANIIAGLRSPVSGFSFHTFIQIGFAGLAIFELLALPLPLQALPGQLEPTHWQAWLNEQRVGSSAITPLSIVILPFAQSSKVEDFEQTTRWMLANRFFRGDILNGYSGFFPSDQAQVRDEMLKFPTPAGIELLQQKGIEYVVVYHSLANTPQTEEVTPYLPLVYQDEVNHVAVYALQK